MTDREQFERWWKKNYDTHANEYDWAWTGFQAGFEHGFYSGCNDKDKLIKNVVHIRHNRKLLCGIKIGDGVIIYISSDYGNCDGLKLCKGCIAIKTS